MDARIVVELTTMCFGMLSLWLRKGGILITQMPLNLLRSCLSTWKGVNQKIPQAHVHFFCVSRNNKEVSHWNGSMGLRSFFSEVILYFWCVILEAGLLCQMKRALMHTGSWKQSFTCFFLQYRFLCIPVFNHPLIMFYHVQVPMNAVCMLSDLPWITVPEQTISSADLDCKNIGTSWHHTQKYWQCYLPNILER
jgi:hypothetical protein